MKIKNNYRNIGIQTTHGNIIGIVESGDSDLIFEEKSLVIKEIASNYPKADDFIWIKKKTKNEYAIDLISPFGEEGEMCGNGVISVLKFLRRRNSNLKKVVFETKVGKRTVSFDDTKKEYCGEIGSIRCIKKIFIKNGQIRKLSYFVDVGEPHIVVVTNDANSFFSLWKKAFLLYNKERTKFSLGVNFNVAQVIEKNRKIFVKTFERGSLRQTKSCGTGSVSAVAVFRHTGLIRNNEVEVETEGGNFLIKKKKGKYFIITKL